MSGQEAKTAVQVRVRQGRVKIHGPNSPDVISGKVPKGFREELTPSEPQLHEINYNDAVALFGKEWADERFPNNQEEANG